MWPPVLFPCEHLSRPVLMAQVVELIPIDHHFCRFWTNVPSSATLMVGFLPVSLNSTS